jgi:hypothetical protein
MDQRQIARFDVNYRTYASAKGAVTGALRPRGRFRHALIIFAAMRLHVATSRSS